MGSVKGGTWPAAAEDACKAPSVVGFHETNDANSTLGDIFFATRPDTVCLNSPTERMRITSWGHLGFGTTTPETEVHMKMDGDSDGLFLGIENTRVGSADSSSAGLYVQSRNSSLRRFTLQSSAARDAPAFHILDADGDALLQLESESNNVTLGVASSWGRFQGSLLVDEEVQFYGMTEMYGGLRLDTDAFTVEDGTGNTAISGILSVSGQTTVVGVTALNGGITMDSNKFTVADETGNTVIAGTLRVAGQSNLNGGVFFDATKFTVEDVTGNTAIGGTLEVTGLTGLNGGLAMDADKFTVADGTGNTVIAGTVAVAEAAQLNGGLTMDSNKFTVADATGNTAIAGTLGVTGATTVTGATALNGGLSMDSDKFTVADATGNTAIAGTLSVTGATVLFGSSTADVDVSHYGSYMVTGSVSVDNVRLDGNTLSATCATASCADGDVIIAPAGSGLVKTTKFAAARGAFGQSGVNSSYKLYVSGEAYSTVGWSSSSDARFKKNVRPLNDVLPSLLKLEPIHFNFDRSKSSRFEGEPEGAEQLGFLAQDLETLFPEVVVTDSEGFKSVKYDKLTVLLAQGLKEQQASIAALHGRLDAALARLASEGGPASSVA